ncbi:MULTISPECIES: Imm1 family immunity protein [Amycolatopsis]|uniref:Immunity protein Imm1 n=1 Tax=Amycolatopsis saalfeldensis TaxID=394193 RepID=A0A1H8YNG5_9PSEU|nr:MULTISPECIES: Imm1 family immunity protein [Amycolatopsis]SEP53720.1 Immunity protein Imm1 [Amycolatopsis saalfeldensis]
MDDVLPEAVEYDITQVADLDALLRTLRAENEKLEDPDMTGGRFWRLNVGPDATEGLRVGVRGAVGSLVWSTPRESFVPTVGMNEDLASYRDIKGYEAPRPPRSEVPINLVYATVAEYYASHRQPVTVQWMAEPSPPRLPGEPDSYMDGAWIPE